MIKYLAIILCLLIMGCISNTPSKFGAEFNRYDKVRYYDKDNHYTGYSITTKYKIRYYNKDSKLIGYSK